MLRQNYLSNDFLFTTCKLLISDSHYKPQTDLLPTHNEFFAFLPINDISQSNIQVKWGTCRKHVQNYTMHKNLHAFYVIC